MSLFLQLVSVIELQQRAIKPDTVPVIINFNVSYLLVTVSDDPKLILYDWLRY
jgi:hypothetical protein